MKQYISEKVGTDVVNLSIVSSGVGLAVGFISIFLSIPLEKYINSYKSGPEGLVFLTAYLTYFLTRYYDDNHLKISKKLEIDEDNIFAILTTHLLGFFYAILVPLILYGIFYWLLPWLNGSL